VISLFSACVTIVIAIYKIRLLIKTTAEAHARNRMQSTIEYLGDLWSSTKDKIKPDLPDLSTLNKLDNIEQYPDDLKSVPQVFETLERMSIGLHHGVYDKTIFYKMVRLITLNNTLKYFEPHLRVLKKSDANYSSSFETLVKEYNSARLQNRE
jgi:hypothetical protein